MKPIRTDLLVDLDRALSLLHALQRGLWEQGFTIRRRRRALRFQPARQVDVRLTAREDGPRQSLSLRLAWPASPPAPQAGNGHPATDARSLRRAFRNALEGKDFHAAMRFGEQMEQQFPDSTMARQFAKLRPTLLRRATGDK